MTLPAPFVSSVLDVQNDWIDYNGHLNMAYYHVLFDRGSDQAFDLMGVGAAYAQARRMTIYAAETHVCYLRELHRGDRVAVSFQLVDCDAKRLRTFQEIRHVDGWVAATCETLSLHVDMDGPKVAPFPADIAERVEAMFVAHSTLPLPDRAGRAITVRRT
jgi:acyl-CoA thioester hydrolase